MRISRRIRQSEQEDAKCYVYIIDITRCQRVNEKALSEAEIVFHNLNDWDWKNSSYKDACKNAKVVLNDFYIDYAGVRSDAEFINSVSCWTRKDVDYFKAVFCKWDDTEWDRWINGAINSEERKAFQRTQKECDVLKSMIEKYETYQANKR